jgi:Uma2 family endonuclease
MSIVAGTGSEFDKHSAEEDPFIHGVRKVKRILEDGTEVYDEIPLRQEDLLFPEEWDRHVITAGHYRDCSYLHNAFIRQVRDIPDAKVLGDLRVDWSHPEIRPLGPDVIVVFGVRGWRDWATIKIAEEGATVALIVEVTSPDTRNNDLVIKRDLYYQLGVEYYAIVDRHERRSGVDVRVLGYGRGPTEFEELPGDERGWIWLEPVKLWLGVEGDRAVCYDADGSPIPEVAELTTLLEGSEQEKNAALLAAAAERQRADIERQRADNEARERAALEERIRQLEAELKQQRGTA